MSTKFVNVLCNALLLSIIFTNCGSCQNALKDPYNESDYQEVSRGIWEKRYTVTFQNRLDKDYAMRKIYADSTYNDSIHFKYFYYKDVMNGPTETFWFGQLGSKGFMKASRLHGEQLRFAGGKIAIQEFYNNGAKSGIWNYFDSAGRIFKKVHYDPRGNFLKQEIFDRRGKLVRTEDKET